MSVVGNKIIIRFNFADTGFKTTDGNPPSLFEICGEDKVFYVANAKISGSVIELTSANVLAPVAARMGWSYTRVTNLRTTDNLPVSVFKTYQWADNTEEK